MQGFELRWASQTGCNLEASTSKTEPYPSNRNQKGFQTSSNQSEREVNWFGFRKFKKKWLVPHCMLGMSGWSLAKWESNWLQDSDLIVLIFFGSLESSMDSENDIYQKRVGEGADGLSVNCVLVFLCNVVLSLCSQVLPSRISCWEVRMIPMVACQQILYVSSNVSLSRLTIWGFRCGSVL